MSDETGENPDKDTDKAALLALLQQLKADHRRIDQEIFAAQDMGAVDMLKTVRMKKIKLILKDKIANIQDRLTPDIIA